MKDFLSKVKRKLFSLPKQPANTDNRIESIKQILDDCLGHLNSFEKQRSIDAQGNPLPWFTYPAIEYLKQLDLNSMDILEWGIGNSSLFFSSRCATLYSVEHNQVWFDLIKESLPNNAYAYLASEEDYAELPKQFKKYFDLIIIDGIKRADCIDVALQLLKQDGVIIFDNSDRNPELCKYIRNKDMIQIDFHGFGPINAYTWTTTLFFSRTNAIKPLSNQPLIPSGGGY